MSECTVCSTIAVLYCCLNHRTFPLNSQVTKENKALKRKSQALLPLIPELPENLAALNLDLEDDSNISVELAEDPLIKSQAQIRGNPTSSDSHSTEILNKI